MSRTFKYFISCLLVAIFMLQPFAPEIAAWAGEVNADRESITSAQEEFQKAYDEIMSIEEVEFGGFTSGILDVASGFKNLGNFLSGQEAEASYNQQIDEANTKIREAKTEAESIKADMDGDALSSSDIDANIAQMQNGFSAASGEVSNQQDALIEAGNTLKDVATMLDGLGILLSGISIILTAVAPFTAGTAAIVAGIITVASIAISAASNALNAAGDSLIEAGESGKMDDASMNADYQANFTKAAISTGVDIAMEIGPGKILGACGVDASTVSAIDDFMNFNVLDEALPNASKYLGEVSPSELYGYVTDTISYVGGPDLGVTMSGSGAVSDLLVETGNAMVDGMRDSPGLE